jgi:hypothetical protein
MPIRRYLEGDSSFSPADIDAMSTALEEVCAVLDIPVKAQGARQTIAARIIELGRQGERNATKLRQRVLAEAESPTGLGGADQGALASWSMTPVAESKLQSS